MSSQSHTLHFVLFPLMAPGHMNPMIDIAKLLAQRGMIVTIVTTPGNAARFKPVVARAVESGLKIKFVELRFPCQEAGLPEGCENFDMLPSLGMAFEFFTAANMLQQQAENMFEEGLISKASCIISDVVLSWTIHISRKFNIPRISFQGTCCFCFLCLHNVHTSKLLESVNSESEYFLLPGILPHQIAMNKEQFPTGPMLPSLKVFDAQMAEAEMGSYGSIMNTFEELEPTFSKEYKKIKGGKLWCIGPVSLCNKDTMDKSERGKSSSTDENQCLKWLDSWPPGSVIYVCLGSICNITPAQNTELGLGLEASNKPFIWVTRGGHILEELDSLEERTKGRGLLIRGWAPQVLILSHPAIGGFLTHCGWNSTLEAVSAGLPMVTWPLFADQFLNEKLVVEVLKIGVSVGVKAWVKWGEEEKIGVLVKKDAVREAVEKVIDEGEEGEERRRRAKELAAMAKKAVEEGGSSYSNITTLIQDIMEQATEGESRIQGDT